MRYALTAIPLCFVIVSSGIENSAAATPAMRRQRVENDSGLSPAQIVRKGLEGFLKSYTRKDESSLRIRQGCYLYAQSKRNENAVRAKRLSVSARKSVSDMRALVSQWEEALITLQYAHSGGGTMYLDFYAGAEARREDLFGAVIRDFAKPEANPNLRHKAVIDARMLGVDIGLARKKFEVWHRDVESAEYRKEFDNAFAAWKRRNAQLASFLKPLVPRAASRIVAYLQHALQTAQEINF